MYAAWDQGCAVNEEKGHLTVIFPLNDVIKMRLIWHFRYVIVDFVNELRIIEQINTFYEFIEICF